MCVSVSAGLHACLDRALTMNFKMSPSKYFTYDQNHVKANGGLLSECSGPGVKTTEVEARVALVTSGTRTMCKCQKFSS